MRFKRRDKLTILTILVDEDHGWTKSGSEPRVLFNREMSYDKTMTNQEDFTEQKLYLAKYSLDERPHIIVTDQHVCRYCEGINGTPQPCMILCPANVFKWEERNGKMENVVSYDNCVECGACRIICPYGNIEWKYPRWGRGYLLRFG